MSLLFRHNVLFTHSKRFIHNSPVWSSQQIDLAKERQAFREVLPDVINGVVSSPKIVVPRAKTWMREFLEYIMVDQISAMGVTIPIGYQMIEKRENITEKSLHDARIMGWCLEMAQTYTILNDDIFDGSATRFGKPCWHRLPNVGIEALNDIMMFQTCVVELVHTKFGKSPKYIEMTLAINEATMRTAMGQYIDCRTTCKKNKEIIKEYNWDQYYVTALLKSASCFRLEMELTCFLLNDSHIKMDPELLEICDSLDVMIAVKDDYLDVYGAKADNGIDIETGKCSWLALQTLQRCNEAQKEMFTECYASDNPEDIQRIKKLYDDLQLPHVYQEYRTNALEQIMKKVDKLPSQELKSYFNFIIRYFNGM